MTDLTLWINGEAQCHAAPLTVEGLLTRLTLTGKRVAVECNGTLVPRSQHATTALKEGDRLEIVVAVGGG